MTIALLTIGSVLLYLLAWYAVSRFSYKVWVKDAISRHIDTNERVCFWIAAIWPLSIWPTLVCHIYHITNGNNRVYLSVVDLFTKGPKHLHAKRIGG